VHLRLERLAAAVVPGIRRDVAVLDEDRGGVPIGGFALQPVATLQQQDALARRCELFGKRAAAGAAADDDNVECLSMPPPL
jgi:hypothetical protein